MLASVLSHYRRAAPVLRGAFLFSTVLLAFGAGRIVAAATIPALSPRR